MIFRWHDDFKKESLSAEMDLKTGQPEIVYKVVNYRNFKAMWGNFQENWRMTSKERAA